MIGKKMALLLLDLVVMRGLECLPEREEEDTKEDGQDANTDRLCLLEDLDNAVQESGNPKEPLEQSSQHETTNDSNIGNLLQSVSVPRRSAGDVLTSLAGQGSVMSGIEPSTSARATTARAARPIISCQTMAGY